MYIKSMVKNKNIMIKNFIESNNSLVDRDNGFLTLALQLTQFGTYNITVRSSWAPLYPRLTESFMNEKDYSFKGKVYQPKKLKTKYSSHATDKVFFEGKSETDDNTTDDDTTTSAGGIQNRSDVIGVDESETQYCSTMYTTTAIR